ncbi:hypothetical protein CDEST_08979 [Colletotrichum destructivum]|uniref:Uncharacterized protein n=1 Tax=Colletotrichum destructivum TaxID=34406 RepID=A0AAX4IKI9_9PEZI|nr:hypothetical protein CDEST_08979 [Colletotrichum destructivum]
MAARCRSPFQTHKRTCRRRSTAGPYSQNGTCKRQQPGTAGPTAGQTEQTGQCKQTLWHFQTQNLRRWHPFLLRLTPGIVTCRDNEYDVLFGFPDHRTTRRLNFILICVGSVWVISSPYK